ATNLKEHKQLADVLRQQAEAGRMIGAICAAPMVLGTMGLLQGRRATCYPGVEHTLHGAEYTGQLVTVDGNIITGEGPAAAFPYAYTLLAMLVGHDKAEEIQIAMRYKHLMAEGS
ncbi:DJ-1/PfpI family protein, partial [Hoylesella shahii]